MRFDKSRKLLEYKVPQDGSGYVDSIRQTFPLDIQADALTPGDDLRTKLDTQEIEQAKTYLHAIGREAEVVYNWRLEKGARLAEMDVEVSNLLLDKFSAYPYWIGSLEKIENGVRYVYTKSWTEEDKGNGIVSFTKYIYDTQEVVAKQACIVRGNVLTALTGSEEIK